jgi:hypothetical protein
MDFQTYELAMELYAKLGNLSEVWRELQKKGIKKNYNTLVKWRQDNRDEWENLRAKFHGKKKEIFVDSLGDELFQDIVDIKKLLLQKVKDGLGGEENKINTQAVICLQRQIEQVSEQLKERQKDSQKAEKYAKKLIEVLLRHRVIGPLLRRFIDEILADVKKELRNV